MAYAKVANLANFLAAGGFNGGHDGGLAHTGLGLALAQPLMSTIRQLLDLSMPYNFLAPEPKPRDWDSYPPMSLKGWYRQNPPKSFS